MVVEVVAEAEAKSKMVGSVAAAAPPTPPPASGECKGRRGDSQQEIMVEAAQVEARFTTSSSSSLSLASLASLRVRLSSGAEAGTLVKDRPSTWGSTDDEDGEEEEERMALWARKEKNTDKIAFQSYTFPQARE